MRRIYFKYNEDNDKMDTIVMFKKSGLDSVVVLNEFDTRNKRTMIRIKENKCIILNACDIDEMMEEFMCIVSKDSMTGEVAYVIDPKLEDGVKCKYLIERKEGNITAYPIIRTENDIVTFNSPSKVYIYDPKVEAAVLSDFFSRMTDIYSFDDNEFVITMNNTPVAICRDFEFVEIRGANNFSFDTEMKCISFHNDGNVVTFDRVDERNIRKALAAILYSMYNKGVRENPSNTNAVMYDLNKLTASKVIMVSVANKKALVVTEYKDDEYTLENMKFERWYPENLFFINDYVKKMIKAYNLEFVYDIIKAIEKQ